MNLPAPSAWRYTHHIPDGTISYQYDTARPKNCNHPNYTPMFTQGQLNQYGQAYFEEGVTELVDALEKLARLGNGEQYGNSDGNMIAREALAKYGNRNDAAP